MRRILAVLAGVLAAGGVIALIEMLVHQQLTGDGRFLGAVIGYGAGALVGTVIAGVIASASVARLIPVMLAGLALINLLSFPHPLWFVPAAAASLLAGWFAGAWLGRLTGKAAPTGEHSE